MAEVEQIDANINRVEATINELTTSLMRRRLWEKQKAPKSKKSTSGSGLKMDVSCHRLSDIIAQFTTENRLRASEADAHVHRIGSVIPTSASAWEAGELCEEHIRKVEDLCNYIHPMSCIYLLQRQKITEVVRTQCVHRQAYLHALTTEYKQRKHRWKKRLAAAEQRQQQVDRAKERRR
jgi:hypothetical protein